MSLPKPLNTFVTRAQINHPVLAGKVIRKLTGAGGKKSPSATENNNVAAVANTSTALNRDNGIDAAKVAAGIPVEH